jgi:hypothetical protein
LSEDPIAVALKRRPPIRPEWLATKVEAIEDPEQEIVDPHHHLWDRPGSRYLFEEVLADFSTCHNVVASVHAPCHSMYLADATPAFGPVVETEFGR